MGERKVLFKTKLCVLYEKGHCRRQTCSFAHGYAELRRFSFNNTNPSFNNGRRDSRNNDLRDTLERRPSPVRRYSPRREGRGRHAPRGYSPSDSDKKRSSDRKRQKKQHFDGQSDGPGSFKVSDRTEDRVGNRRLISSEPISAMGEQLRQARAEIDALNNRKYQLKVNLEKRVHEVDSLASRIEELQNQLFQEKEECKRTVTKINKFVKAHKRYSRLQDELKRSYDLLQKMGDQLCIKEDASDINMLSDGEITGNMIKGGVRETIRMEKHVRWNEQEGQSDNNEVADQRHNGSNGHGILLNGTKTKRGKIDIINAASEEKGHEPGFSLPPTSMAAHAIDEGIETADHEDYPEATKTTSKGFNEGATNGILQFPLPPPPPLSQNAYAQYRGMDENLEVDELEDDSFDVDIV